MSSAEYLREFVNERLTAAAEEIFGVFIKTVVEYEEEIDRQRRLLDIVWKPEIKLHRIELQQQHVNEEEEVLADQQLFNQERSFSLDQEDPEPPKIEEEQEELCTSQEGEELVLETDTFMLTPANGESDHQLLSDNSHVADQKEGKNGGSGSTRATETKPKTHTHHKFESHSNNVNKPNRSDIHYNTQTGKKSLRCDICGKAFMHKSKLDQHLRGHTGEKPFPCDTCGKRFMRKFDLHVHKRNHTGERPYTCKTCGKSFTLSHPLWVHMRTHTGEKPFSCQTCGKEFRHNCSLLIHMRTHTGEKPYSCQTCGKEFRHNSSMLIHMRTHTGEKPYSCKTCGKGFMDNSTLKRHMRAHICE